MEAQFSLSGAEPVKQVYGVLGGLSGVSADRRGGWEGEHWYNLHPEMSSVQNVHLEPKTMATSDTSWL